MKRLSTEVEIAATPEKVWEVLTDLDSYEEWNAHIVSASGNVAKGDRLDLEMTTPKGKKMRFTPFVTEAIPNRSFEWLGKLGLKGVFDGRHRFDLEPTAKGIRLIHGEEFTGVLSPMIFRMIGDQTRADFETMNAGLKERVESGA
ncbi:MAG: SRPBCC domain-containing protein [Actinomycetota bacterium]|nr:SRPBCC domain-containing protein [Actinomycetota bacterium]